MHVILTSRVSLCNWMFPTAPNPNRPRLGSCNQAVYIHIYIYDKYFIFFCNYIFWGVRLGTARTVGEISKKSNSKDFDDFDFDGCFLDLPFSMFSKLPQKPIRPCCGIIEHPFVREVSACILECTNNIELDQPCKIRKEKTIMNQNIGNPYSILHISLFLYDITPNQSILTYDYFSNPLHYLLALHTGKLLGSFDFSRGEQPPDVPEVLFNVVSLEVLFASARLLKKVPGVHAARLFVPCGELGRERNNFLGSFQGGDFLGDGEAVAEWKII